LKSTVGGALPAGVAALDSDGANGVAAPPPPLLASPRTSSTTNATGAPPELALTATDGAIASARLSSTSPDAAKHSDAFGLAPV
jgi:hypothetical protein